MIDGAESNQSVRTDEHANAMEVSRQPQQDAEWRRKLFGLVDDDRGSSDADRGSSDAPAQIRDEPRGLRARAVKTLDKYLGAMATELDERGDTLRRRSLALEQEAERLAALESANDQRARRIREHGITDEHTAGQLDELVEKVAEREERVREISSDRDLVRQELAIAQEKLKASAAKATECERRLAEQEARAKVLSAEREALRGELQAVEAEIARRDEIVAKLESTNATQAANLADARGMLDEHAERARELERDVAERDAALSTAQYELRELRAETAIQELPQSVVVATEETTPFEPEDGSATHLLLVPGGGCYALIERPGPPPNVGAPIADVDHQDGRRFVVTQIGESPLPLDQRACAYLQPRE